MTATSKSRMAVLLVVLVAAIGLALVFALQYGRREPPVGTKAGTVAPAVSKPLPVPPDQGRAALPKAPSEIGALADALAGSPPPPESGNSVPTFDIARVESTGEAVIAGRAAPGVTVELLRNGEIHDRATVDQSGQFAMVPPRLPPGSYELTLRARKPDGTLTSSKQSVAVMLEPKPNAPPVVALMTPEKPTVVLSKPAAPKPVAGTVVVEAVDIEPNGKLHVSGRAGPGAAVRFYLNDSFVASVTAGADGRFAITINEGVVAGNYRVRLDEVEPNSGDVRARAEVPLNVPGRVAAASAPAKAASTQPDSAIAQQPPAVLPQAVPQPPIVSQQPSAISPPVVAQQSTAVAEPPKVAAQPVRPADTRPPGGSSPSAVVIPKIKTATVARGDNLWRISRDTYGAGIRYSVIFGANRDQIRNPNLIYPGQIFVLPTR